MSRVDATKSSAVFLRQSDRCPSSEWLLDMHHVPGRVHLPLNHPLRFRQQLGYIKYSIGPLRGSREIGQRAEMRV